MGQHADEIINGECCALCGCYFEQFSGEHFEEEIQIYEHGYAVACWDCYDQNCGYPKADVETL